ncbi:MAG: carbohydrate ABC transporter permease, partial [Candidatus Rokubacteria bacterium]|nr:carbohydrate ABC transporter permease [Candidatus Rokubacteria bacterium]
MNPRPWWAKLGHGSLLLLATVYCLFPIYFMLVQSLKTPTEDVFGNPFIVMNPTLENFKDLFEHEGEVRGFVGDALRRSYPFVDWLVNTLLVFAGSIAATLVVSVAAAYALGRLRPVGTPPSSAPAMSAPQKKLARRHPRVHAGTANN